MTFSVTVVEQMVLETLTPHPITIKGVGIGTGVDGTGNIDTPSNKGSDVVNEVDRAEAESPVDTDTSSNEGADVGKETESSSSRSDIVCAESIEKKRKHQQM